MQDPLLRRAGIGLAIAASISVAVGVLAATVRYEPYGVADSELAKYEQVMEQLREQAALAKQPLTAAESPVAVTDKTEHDFGLMDPFTEASHEFLVRNEGTAPLSLIVGDTSCKCTLSSVASRVVRPGGETTVTLTWNSGRTREFYRQYAVIRTNDPRRPEIELGVRGTVRGEFAASAQEVAFSDTEPGEPAERKVAIYSQVWDRFELEQIETDVEDLTWTVQPLTRPQLEEFQAKSGFAVTIRVSGDRPPGYFAGILRMRLLPQLEAPVAGMLESTEGGDALAEANSENPMALEEELGFVSGERHAQRVRNSRAGRRAANSGREEPGKRPALKQSLAPGTIEISVRGKVLLPISLYGPAVHMVDGIQVGSVPIGEAKATKVLVKVHGSKQPAHLRVGSIEPAFLHAAISKTSKYGFYELVVKVPAGSPQRNFSGALSGEMVLECDLLEGGKMRIGIEGDTLGNPTRRPQHP